MKKLKWKQETFRLFANSFIVGAASAGSRVADNNTEPRREFIQSFILNERNFKYLQQ